MDNGNELVHFHSVLKPRPLGGVMNIGYALETLRDEAPLHAASTPAAKAVLAAGYRNDVGESNEAVACTPRLGLQQTSSLRSERRSGKRPPMGARSKPRPLGGAVCESKTRQDNRIDGMRNWRFRKFPWWEDLGVLGWDVESSNKIQTSSQ